MHGFHAARATREVPQANVCLYRYTPAYLQLPVYPCMHVHAAIIASYRLAAILLRIRSYVAKLKV